MVVDQRNIETRVSALLGFFSNLDATQASTRMSRYEYGLVTYMMPWISLEQTQMTCTCMQSNIIADTFLWMSKMSIQKCGFRDGSFV